MRYYLARNYETAVSHEYCVRCGRSLDAVVSAEPIRYQANDGRAVHRAYLICSAIRVKSFLWGLRAVFSKHSVHKLEAQRVGDGWQLMLPEVKVE